MLSVLVWFGNANHMSLLGHVSKVNEIKVFSQLGGGCVGSINLLANQHDASKVLISMQRQIAKLMPHKLRDSRDVVIYADQARLTPPDFGYEFKPCEDCTTRLEQVKQAKKVLAKYDETDEYAMTVVNSMMGFHTLAIKPTYGAVGNLVANVWAVSLLRHEMRALHHHYDNLVGMRVDANRSTKYALVDMSVLLDMPSLCWCTLTGMLPSQWCHLKNLVCINMNLLANVPMSIPEELGKLPNLEELNVGGPATALPQSFGNLAKLKLEATRLCLPDVMHSLLNTPSITGLVLKRNYFTNKGDNTIPTTFGKLTRLTELCITGNGFRGPVPQEINQLTNLTKLHVCEDFGSSDVILHPSISALNIPDLRVERMRYTLE